MPPIEGRFEFDMSSAATESDKAVASFGRVEAEAGKVTAAVDGIGTAKPFVGMQTGSVTAQTGLRALAASLSQVDNSLQALGVRVGPAERAINELAGAAGKSVVELGAVATGGLAVSAAMAGVDFGRWIAGWAGTDKIIGDATAKLLGWGDVAGQQAAAAADTLARASKLAGIEITNMDTAILVLSADAADAAARMGKFAGAIADIKAPADFAAALDKIHGQVEILRTKDVEGFGELTTAIKNHVASATDIARVYDVSTQAAQRYIDEVTRDAAIEEKNAKILLDLRKQEVDAIIARQEANRKASEERHKQLSQETEDEYALTEAKKKERDAEDDRRRAEEQSLAVTRAKADEDRRAAEKANREATYAIDYTQPGALQRPAQSVEDFIRAFRSYEAGTTAYLQDQAARAAAQQAVAGQAPLRPTPSFAVIGPGNVVSTSAVGAGVSVNINVSGVWDMTAQRQLKDAVNQAIMPALLQRRTV